MWSVDLWILNLVNELHNKNKLQRDRIIRQALYKLPVHEMAAKRHSDLQHEYNRLEEEHQDCDRGYGP